MIRLTFSNSSRNIPLWLNLKYRFTIIRLSLTYFCMLKKVEKFSSLFSNTCQYKKRKEMKSRKKKEKILQSLRPTGQLLEPAPTTILQNSRVVNFCHWMTVPAWSKIDFFSKENASVRKWRTYKFKQQSHSKWVFVFKYITDRMLLSVGIFSEVKKNCAWSPIDHAKIKYFPHTLIRPGGDNKPKETVHQYNAYC